MTIVPPEDVEREAMKKGESYRLKKKGLLACGIIALVLIGAVVGLHTMGYTNKEKPTYSVESDKLAIVEPVKKAQENPVPNKKIEITGPVEDTAYDIYGDPQEELKKYNEELKEKVKKIIDGAPQNNDV